MQARRGRTDLGRRGLGALALAVVSILAFASARAGGLSSEARMPEASPSSAGNRVLDLDRAPALLLGRPADAGGTTETATETETIASRPGSATTSEASAGWSDAGSAMPAYLRDDEPMRAQLKQLRLQVAHGDPAELWSRHVVPFLAPSAMAQEVTTSTEPTQAELDAFRQQLMTFADDLAAVLDRLPEDMTLDAHLRIASSSESLEMVSYDELAQIRAALHDYPGFWDLPSYLDHALSSDSDPWLEPEGPPGLAPSARPTLPSVPAEDLQYDNCLTYAYASTCAGCPQVDGVALLSAAFALEVAAKGVELALDLCPKKIFIASKTFYSPCAIILASVKTGIELSAAALLFALDQADECEEDYHLGLVHLYLDETVSSRASEQSHDYHSLRTLRIEIENALLRDADDRLGLFQLPADQGGYLDRGGEVSVRFVVQDTIDLMNSLGYDVRNAQAEFDDGDDLLDAGDYQGAFARYRLAYRAAVRVGRELPPVSFP